MGLRPTRARNAKAPHRIRWGAGVAGLFSEKVNEERDNGIWVERLSVSFSRSERHACLEEVVEDPVHERGHRELSSGSREVRDLELVEAADVPILDKRLV
jgi:hypothetical protein